MSQRSSDSTATTTKGRILSALSFVIVCTLGNDRNRCRHFLEIAITVCNTWWCWHRRPQAKLTKSCDHGIPDALIHDDFICTVHLLHQFLVAGPQSRSKVCYCGSSVLLRSETGASCCLHTAFVPRQVIEVT